MRRSRLFLIFALLLVIILAAVFVLSQGSLFGSAEATAEPTIPLPPTAVPVKVIIVTQKIPRGMKLVTEVMDQVEISEDLLVQGMLTNMDEVLDRRAKFDLAPGTILMSNMLAESVTDLSTAGSDWAMEIDTGMVAVSIPISRLSSVSYAPRRGDHVNVIATLNFVDLDTAFQSKLPNSVASVIASGVQNPEFGPNFLTAQLIGTTGEGRLQEDAALDSKIYVYPSEAQRARMVSQTLIENVKVLQVGNFPLPEEEIKQTAVPTPGGTPVAPEAQQQVQESTATPTPLTLPDSITLIVSPQDAVTLNYLIFSGAKLTLALRATNDLTSTKTEAVTLQYLLERYNIPIPVKLPFGFEPRVDVLASPVMPNDPTPAAP